ncbi:MAG: efflux RND transporter periplasmic adaptor subunit [Paludibacteraceae bacterium]|nr:efflux RND transporter periplasmic adaptor subunit [Paludibacteraceae bacterium]
MKQIIPIVLFLAVIVSGCSNDATTVLRNVEVIQPSSLSNTQQYVYFGKVQDRSEVSLAFKVAGQIKQIAVKEGETVQKGQLLAQLDDKDYVLQHRVNVARYEQFKNEFARIQTLYERKAVSANDYEKAQAGLKQLEVALEGGERQIEYTCLVAPEDGLVTTVNGRESQLVDAGTPIMTFMNKGEMQVLTDIPYEQQERLLHALRITGNNQYNLSLSSIVPKTDNNQLCQVRLVFNQPTTNVLPGMNMTIHVEVENPQKGGLTLPIHTLFDNNGQQCVWVLQPDSTVRSVPVKVAFTNDGKAEILEGLQGNEQVVKAGVNHLVEGEHVRVL